MTTVRVVWGTGTGPTAVASFDAALADAGLQDYNLATVSSVIPPAATLEVVGTAPDLGPTGDRLTVVLSRRTVAPGAEKPAVAGLGWARGEDGGGVFYEATGGGPDAVRAEIRDGLAHAGAIRDWSGGAAVGPEILVRERGPAADAFATAVVLAVYGEGQPIA